MCAKLPCCRGSGCTHRGPDLLPGLGEDYIGAKVFGRFAFAKAAFSSLTHIIN